MSELQGVVLAAGFSSRMGFPKALAAIGDSTFLDVVSMRLLEAGIHPVHVVLNQHVAGLLAGRGPLPQHLRIVLNPEPEAGQFRSMQLGLAAAQRAGAGAAAVALVDLPRVRADTVKLLAAEHRLAPRRLIIPAYGGRHGHPFIVPEEFFPAFLEAHSGQTGRDVVHALAAFTQTVAVDDPAILADIDTPADYEAALRAERQRE